MILSLVILALAAYLLGSIPTGYLVAKARGVDIRTVGSGNIGATNAFRVLGKPAGSFVLLVDAAKGFLACWGLPLLLLRSGMIPQDAGSLRDWLPVIAGFSAILGHNYTCWLSFRGGKGIATSAGVLLALLPLALLASAIAFAITLAISRYVSLGSIVAALVLPFAAWWTGASSVLIGTTILMSTLAIYKHRANIVRLLQGTENRVGQKKAEARP